ncbi:MAG: alpha-amylase family glycosyl hydrolase, partial [Planctomycetota bacterium]
FNHTGRDFFAFQNLVEKQEDSPYRDWYIVQSFDNPDTPQNEFKYKGWWGVQTLPEFADNDAGDDLHPGPKEYIFDATAKWMDPDGDGDPSDGIDGWRLDVAAEVPNGFWSDWNDHCRELNPECYTVAEHWDDAAKFLAEGGFSATMNYHGFAFPMKGYLVDGTTSAGDAARELVARMNEFPSARRYALQNLMDSHDTDRLASMIVNAPNGRPYLQPGRSDYDVTERVSPRYWDGYDIRKPNDAEWRIQRLVALMQATFVGPPMIYYGTESGMWGADDPCDRMPMIWDDLEYEPQTADPLGRERPVDEVAFDQDLFDFYKAVFQLRSGSDALQTGDFEVLAADDSKGALAFKRSQEGETVYVFFNRGDESAELVVPIGDGEIEEIFTASGNPQGVQFDLQEGSLGVVLPAVEGVVLRETKTAE